MLNKLEKALGYKFRDPELLRMALTHTSCANEIYQDPLRSYERLEFLGDSIVGFVEYLWDVLLMLLMYCSAIFYYVDNIGSSVVRTVIRMNPLYCIIENFRHVVLLGESIFTSSMEINMLIYSSVFSVVALIISVIVFKKNQDRFILYI